MKVSPESMKSIKEFVEKGVLRTTAVITFVAAIVIPLVKAWKGIDDTLWMTAIVPNLILLFATSIFLQLSLFRDDAKTEFANTGQHLTQLTKITGEQFTTLESRIRTEKGRYRFFTSNREALDYLGFQYTNASLSIRQGAIAPSIRPSREYSDYDRAVYKVLAENKVKYTHVVLLDQERWQRVKIYLMDPELHTYFLTYYEDAEIPSMSFAVIDDREVVMRYPESDGGRVLWLATDQPEIVSLFVNYFEKLLSKGTHLGKGDATKITRLDKKFGVP